MKRVKCKSGIEGWQCKLRENWISIEELESADRNYGVLSRLGFDNVEEAWETNPTIRGSVNASDLTAVK